MNRAHLIEGLGASAMATGLGGCPGGVKVWLLDVIAPTKPLASLVLANFR